MRVGVPEHQDVSHRTCKQVKGTLSTWLRDHMLNCNHCNYKSISNLPLEPLKTFHLLYHNAYGHQTWQSGDLQLRTPNP